MREIGALSSCEISPSCSFCAPRCDSCRSASPSRIGPRYSRWSGFSTQEARPDSAVLALRSAWRVSLASVREITKKGRGAPELECTWPAPSGAWPCARRRTLDLAPFEAVGVLIPSPFDGGFSLGPKPMSISAPQTFLLEGSGKPARGEKCHLQRRPLLITLR